jgi:hypothetical protein
MASMDVDSHDSAQGQHIEDGGNPQRPARVKGADNENGTTTVQTEVVALRPPLRAGSVPQREGLVEEITDQPDSDAEERHMEVGTSSKL